MIGTSCRGSEFGKDDTVRNHDIGRCHGLWRKGDMETMTLMRRHDVMVSGERMTRWQTMTSGDVMVCLCYTRARTGAAIGSLKRPMHGERMSWFPFRPAKGGQAPIRLTAGACHPLLARAL